MHIFSSDSRTILLKNRCTSTLRLSISKKKKTIRLGKFKKTDCFYLNIKTRITIKYKSRER
jgi:hypothetical protein